MSVPIRYRLAVTSRVLAAAVGGYALTAAIATLMSLLMPLQLAQSVEIGTFLSFGVYAVVLCWAFHVRSVSRLWVWLIVWTALVALACWGLLRHGGGA